MTLSNHKFRSLMVISPTMSMHQIDCNVIVNVSRLQRWLPQIQIHLAPNWSISAQNIRNIWKMCYRQSRRGVSRRNSEKCKTIVCIADTLLHTYTFAHNAFTHRLFYTQKLWRSNLISCKRVARQVGIDFKSSRATLCTKWVRSSKTEAISKLQSPAFCTKWGSIVKNWGTFHKMRFDRQKLRKNAILPQFLMIEPHFVRKGCPETLQLASFPQFLTIEPYFVRKGCPGALCVLDMPTFLILANCAEYPFFHRFCIYQDRATEHLRPNSRKKRKGCPGATSATRNFSAVFDLHSRTIRRLVGSWDIEKVYAGVARSTLGAPF